MNAEVKRKWIEALRSGQYEQGNCALHSDDNTYCCLGVLCELHRITTDGPAWEYAGAGNFQYLGSDQYLPAEVAAWAGLAGIDPRISVRGTITDLNDIEDYSFDEIADVIEHEL